MPDHLSSELSLGRSILPPYLHPMYNAKANEARRQWKCLLATSRHPLQTRPLCRVTLGLFDKLGTHQHILTRSQPFMGLR